MGCPVAGGRLLAAGGDAAPTPLGAPAGAANTLYIGPHGEFFQPS